MANPLVHQPHKVYTKARWAHDWTEQPGLYCDTCSFAANPDVSEAVLSYNYGLVMGPNEYAFSVRLAQQLSGHYVKIEIEQGTEEPEGEGEPTPKDKRKWFGVVVDDTEHREGALPPDGTFTGKQFIQCRGLEYLLQRCYVRSSFVEAGDDTEKEIGRAIGFNLGIGDESSAFRVPNMGGSGELGAPIFAEVPGEDTAFFWNGEDILNYLLLYHGPKDVHGDEKIYISPDTEVNFDILKALKPTLHAEGKSVWQILNELIDRRRLMAWKLEVLDGLADSDSIFLTVFTFNHESITLPSEIIVPANENTEELDLRNDPLIHGLKLTTDNAMVFDRVRARGERLGSCFTINNDPDGTLEADWDSTLQTAYNTGALGAGNYSALDDYAKIDAHRHYRTADKFKKVYRYFRVPTDWAGIVGSSTIACPDPTSESETPPSTVFWYPGLRFRPILPLLTEHDYGDIEAVTSEMLEGSKAEYLRPFALIYDTAAERYYPIDKLSQGEEVDISPTTNGRHWSASLRMQDDALGIIVDVHGYPQHAIASGSFTAADSVDAADYPADMLWQNIYATVFCEFDQHVEALWPEEPLTTDADTIRELTIDVPNARLDYLAPGTLIGIDNEGDALATAGGYVRDDRELLKDIAKTAYQWYSTDRKAISFTQHSLITDLEVGTLITVLDDDSVNSVITKLTFDLLAGAVLVQTQFGELDFR